MNSKEIVATGKSRLLRSVIEQRSMKQLIEIGEELLGNPLVLCTNNHYIWHAGQLPAACGIPGQVGEFIDAGSFPADLFADDTGPQLIQSPDGKYGLQFCGMSYAGVSRGYSFLVEVKPFKPGTYELHKAFCDIISHSMEKLGYSGIMLQASPIEIELIHKLEDPHYEAADNLKIDSLRQMSRYMEFVACTFAGDARSYAPDSRIIEGLRQLTGSEICFGFSRYIVALVPFQTTSALRQELTRFMELHDMVCGISYPFDQNSDLKLHFAQATDMASLWTSAKDRVVWFAGRFYQNMICGLNPDQSLIGECQADICQIMIYDAEHGADLMGTLKVYFQNNLNIRETADALGIHRNSALARIQKIRSMLHAESSLSMDGYFSILKAELIKTGT